VAAREPHDRPSRAPLVALVVVAVAATAVLGVVATGRGGDEKRSPGQALAGSAVFRGGQLPRGIYRRPAPRVRLRDVRGGSLDTRDLRGRPYALTFLYVNCPDVCPLIGDEIARALELLGSRARDVAAVAVSVDPKGDAPEAVRAWIRGHRLPGNFHYLIGSERQLRPVWDAYYAAPQIPGRPESTHSASIWLVDAAGRWRTKFSAGIPVAPNDLAHDFRVLLRERDERAAATRSR
jgi:protein SCO1